MKYIGILVLGAIGLQAPLARASTVTSPETVTGCAVSSINPVLEVNGAPLGRNPYGVMWANPVPWFAYDVAPSVSTNPPDTYGVNWDVIGDQARWSADWNAGFTGLFTASPNIADLSITVNNVNYHHSGCIGQFANGDQFEVLYDVLGGNNRHNHFWLPTPGLDLHSPGAVQLWGSQFTFAARIAAAETFTRTAIHIDGSNGEVTEGAYQCPRNGVSIYHYDQAPGVTRGTTVLRMVTVLHSYKANGDGTVTFCIAPKNTVGSIPYTDVYMVMTREDGAAFYVRPTEISRDTGSLNIKDWATSTKQIVSIWPNPPRTMLSSDGVSFQSNGLEGLSSDGTTFYHLELLTNSTGQPTGTAAIQALWWGSNTTEGNFTNPSSGP